MTHDGKKIGLALSGGGYRAAAYHIGTLKALHKMKILDKVDVISSVSGGSITAAYYLLNKDDFDYFENTFREKLTCGVLQTSVMLVCVYGFIILTFIIGTIITICSDISVCCKLLLTIPIWFMVFTLFICEQYNLLPLSKLIGRRYEKHFFKGKKMCDLPNIPKVTINATEVTHNRLFSFSKNKISSWDFKNGLFDIENIPISLAVMASSTYPIGIEPIVFPDAYMKQKRVKSQKPYLIDGGIYDNQGCNKLRDRRSSYYTDYSIISLAENDNPSFKQYSNTISLLVRVVKMALNRIDKLQEQINMYTSDNNESRCAYVVLKWNDNLDDIPRRFIRNVRDGHVSYELFAYHGFSQEEYNEIYNNTQFNKWDIYLKKFKDHLDWDTLEKTRPSSETINIAYGVSTNLFGLSEKEINSLVAFSEWMTELQVKTYLPNLL